MTLDLLDKMLEKSPVFIEGNIINLGTLSGVKVVRNPHYFLEKYDRLSLKSLEDQKVALIDENETNISRRGFPKFYLEERPDPIKINDFLFKNVKLFSELLINQNNLWQEIKNHIEKDVIILVIVDGLSYFDCVPKYEAKPCLVNDITKTREGYISIIGKPTIAQRLLNVGFVNLRGYSYWTRENDDTITDSIFTAFPKETMFKVNNFDQIIDNLEQKTLYKSYIQIVLGGLDHISHHSYDEPIIEPYIDRIFERLEKLKQLLISKKRKGVVIMTSDHGLLWRNKHNFEVLDDYILKDNSGVRYTNGKIIRDYLYPLNSCNKNYSLLKYPYITRSLRSTEWGIHGGISAWESIVPYVTKEVN